jgi:sugar phosphate isomerase/epimerase
MRQLGIDCLSVFGLPPVPFVQLAAELGCNFISLGLPPRCNPENYPAYSLKDPATQRETKAALKDHGISLLVAEGVFILPKRDVADSAADLDIMAELGARAVNVVGIEPDRTRCFDQFAHLAEMAAARGMESRVEFVAGLPVGTLADGIEAIRHVGRPDMKLVVDMMHLGRSGGTVADVMNADPSLFGYIQVCDCMNEGGDRVWEQTFERMRPGDGELPLAGFLAALPRDLPVGMEIPQRSLAEMGLGPKERLAPCVAATRSLLAKIAEK